MSAASMLDSVVFGSLWSHQAVRAIFDETARTRAWLELIAVLAEVEAEFDLVPTTAARAIALCCRTMTVDEKLLDEMRRGRESTGHSMQGLILTIQSRLDDGEAQWVYTGATVQDVTDTWLMLALRDVRLVILGEMAGTERALVALARRHRDTPMAGRTHGQHGLPITFGFKAATWLLELRRHRQRFSEIAARMDVVQLSGGVGSLSSFGPRGLDVQYRFAQRLGMRAPLASWTSSRDVFAEWCSLLTMLTGTADRIGHEVYNLQRSEIGELREGLPLGTIGSITMPHKRNPEIGEHLGTLARLTRHLGSAVAEGLVHDHERDGRAWKAEWIAVPEATMLAGRAIELLAQLLSGLEVDEQRMRLNLESGGGFMLSEAIMLALAPRMGRDAAHRLIYELSIKARSSGQTFIDAVRSEQLIIDHLTPCEIDALLDVTSHVGLCAEMVDRALKEVV